MGSRRDAGCVGLGISPEPGTEEAIMKYAYRTDVAAQATPSLAFAQNDVFMADVNDICAWVSRHRMPLSA